MRRGRHLRGRRRHGTLRPMAGVSTAGSPSRAFAALFAVLFARVERAAPCLRHPAAGRLSQPSRARGDLLRDCRPIAGSRSSSTRFAWRPIPDLAMDRVVPPLLSVLPLEAAGKLFVLASFVLLAGGAAALHRVLFGRWSAWPCLAFLLLYGRLLLWGFSIICSASAWRVAALAAMDRARASAATRSESWPGPSFALALYFAHLMAFGVYAVLLLGFEAAGRCAGAHRSGRRSAAGGRGAAARGAACASCWPCGRRRRRRVSFSQPWRKLDLLFSVFDLYHRPFDVACFALAVAGLGWAYWRRWLVLAPAMTLPLALLAIVYFAMPSQLLGASGASTGGCRWRWPARLRKQRLGRAAAAARARHPRRAPPRMFVAAARHRRRELAGERPRLSRAPRGARSVPVGSRIAVAAPPEGGQRGGDAAASICRCWRRRARDAFVPTLVRRGGAAADRLRRRLSRARRRPSPDRLWRAFTGAAPLDEPTAPCCAATTTSSSSAAALRARRPPGLVAAFLAPRLQLYRIAG